MYARGIATHRKDRATAESYITGLLLNDKPNEEEVQEVRYHRKQECELIINHIEYINNKTYG